MREKEDGVKRLCNKIMSIRLKENLYKKIVWLYMLYGTVSSNYKRSYTQDTSKTDV